MSEDTVSPMIFMDDAIRPTIQLMNVPKKDVKIRTSNNITGVSFSPAQVVVQIRNRYPKFEVEYAPDYRQVIASQWSISIDDAEVIDDWGWKARYDLKKIKETMIGKLEDK